MTGGEDTLLLIHTPHFSLISIHHTFHISLFSSSYLSLTSIFLTKLERVVGVVSCSTTFKGRVIFLNSHLQFIRHIIHIYKTCGVSLTCVGAGRGVHYQVFEKNLSGGHLFIFPSPPSTVINNGQFISCLSLL